MNGIIISFCIVLTASFVYSQGRTATAPKGQFDPRRTLAISEFGKSAEGYPSLLAKDQANAKKENDIFASLTDDTVFVKVSSNDFLTWRQLREQAEISIKNNKLPTPAGVSDKDTSEMIAFFLKNNVSKILRRYLRTAVLADEARNLGLQSPSDDAFNTMRTNAIDICENRGGAAAKRELELMKAPDSFFERNLTNVVWAQTYVEKILKPEVEKTINNENVQNAIARRHSFNLSVPATNVLIRTQMEGILQDVLTNKLSFAEAAAEYSDDANSDEGGLFGTFERGDVRPELEAVFTNMVPGQIKGVVETPYSYHIIKLLAKNEEEGEEPSWEIAHIVMEKIQERPEFTPETAREFLVARALSKEVRNRQNKMLLEKPIECVVPLQDKKRTKRRRSSTTVSQGKGK